MDDFPRYVPRRQSGRYSVHHGHGNALSACMCAYRYDAFSRILQRQQSFYPFYYLPRVQLFARDDFSLRSAWHYYSAVSFFTLQLCQMVQQTGNILARLRKHAVILHFTTLLLQAEVEQFQPQIFQFAVRFTIVEFLNLFATLISFRHSRPPLALKSGSAPAVCGLPVPPLPWRPLR